MYVPKHQYRVRSIINTEARVQYEDGTPYTKGSFIELSNGDAYEVPAEDLERGDFRRARRLITDLFTNIPGTLLSLLRSFIARKKAGQKQILRYFVKHKVVNKLNEVSEEDFRNEQDNPASYKEYYTIPWTVAGSQQDTIQNGFVYKGALTRNKEAVEREGLQGFITDYAFLTEDTTPDNIIQKYVNHFDIPSPSKRLGS